MAQPKTRDDNESDAIEGDSTSNPGPADYATELNLFENGEIDQSLWAQHLIEAEGDKEKAKWTYLKQRVVIRAQSHNSQKIDGADGDSYDHHEQDSPTEMAQDKSVESIEETAEQRRERQRQERLISQSIAKGTPSYYLNNPHMLQKDNTMRNVLLVIGVLVLVGLCAG